MAKLPSSNLTIFLAKISKHLRHHRFYDIITISNLEKIMSKKLTIEQVKIEFKNRGWELKSDIYEKNILPLIAICPCGHETTISWNNLKSGQGCKICAGNEAYSYEEVKKIFEAAGCDLLAESYKNVMTPMSYICNCGNESEIRFCDFRQGTRCWKCRSQKISNAIKTNDENIKEFCESKGCQFIESFIQCKRTRIKYICACGSESEAYWGNFKKFPNCKKCGSAKISGSNCYMYDPDREAIALRKKFRKICGQHIKRFMESTGQKKTLHTHELLGYMPQDLQNHILNHPNYKNCEGKEWHVDHIFPIQAFLDHGILDLKIINKLCNLQPILGPENLKKADKYNQKEFLEWIKNNK